MSENEKMYRRITKNKTTWTIAIDDGYVSYKYNLKASGKYSIQSLFNDIQKKVRKTR